MSKDNLLTIVMQITNVSQTKKVDYRTWGAKSLSMRRDFAKVRDEYDNFYKRLDFGFGNKPTGRTEQASIRPGESMTDVLIFERPVDAARFLHLELPGANFGGEGMIRFEIPLTKNKR